MITHVLEWLLDSDPSVRWQVLRDLTDEPAGVVDSERAKVATQGWGAQLLSLQDPDGHWDGGTYRPGWVDDTRPFFDAWTATHFSLQLLVEFGLDPNDGRAQEALRLLRENVVWDVDDAPYFDGEAEPCVNGIALRSGAYFGERVEKIVDRLLDDQLSDGGWNCWAEYGATVSSLHSTICVIEGLLAWEQAGGDSGRVATVRREAEEYLLERKLFRSRRSGMVIDPRYTLFSFPTRWYYDLLRGLDHFRATGGVIDERCAEAVGLVEEKGSDGRWPLENVHQGPTLFRMEGAEGHPSRWNTLRAMRVLAWARGD